MPTAAFLDAVDRSAGLDALIRSTEKARMFFVEQMIVCNTVHKLEQMRALAVAGGGPRVARGVPPDARLPVHHAGRAPRHGQRGGESLHDVGAIEYAHGRVRIVDRAILESQSCECYKLAARVFDAALDTWGLALIGRKRRFIAGVR